MKSDDKSDSDLSVSLMSNDLSTFLSNQIYVLHFCLKNCETVVVKTFAAEY